MQNFSEGSSADGDNEFYDVGLEMVALGLHILRATINQDF